jgi:nitrogen fixation/metabolism regulation signal transduction histidine kinase
VRVIAALVLLGTLCVGASAYLVHLAVGYFDTRVTSALTQGQEIAQSVEPFHHALVESHIVGYQARGRALALELAVGDAGTDPATDDERLAVLLAREPDIVQLRLERPDGAIAERSREDEFPETDYDWFPVTAGLEGPGQTASGTLNTVFRIDPNIDARYQALGERKREIGLEQSSQVEIERAVAKVIGGASILVLLGSVFAGLMLARTTTAKASELSRVMRRVGQGELGVRARQLGRDELGQLGEAFNRMLDELQAAQAKLGYLQRIGAWQEMARRIAHEIKNPLTPIQLAVQQLRDKDPGLSPEFSQMLRTSVEIVEDEIRGLRRMVTSFSQFAKVPEVRLEPVGLGRILDEFERAYGHLTDEAEDVLVVRPPADDVQVFADRQLLKQTLVNLVENAVQSAREAERRPVVVEVSSQIADGVADVCVDDNGPGIATDRKERVFEPYETSREEGTGLGLAIVKKIVLDHGGEIWVEDSALGGARFVMRLPLA